MCLNSNLIFVAFIMGLFFLHEFGFFNYEGFGCSRLRSSWSLGTQRHYCSRNSIHSGSRVAGHCTLRQSFWSNACVPNVSKYNAWVAAGNRGRAKQAYDAAASASLRRCGVGKCIKK